MTENTEKPAGARLAEIAASVRMHLELEQAWGAERLPFRPEKVKEHRMKRVAAQKAAAARRTAAPQAAAEARVATARKLAATGKEAELDAIRQKLERHCCCELGKTRTNLVFGEGSADAGLMFVGEAPGESEDLQGRPFVGRAGQLLTKIIEAMGFTREDVYIANICKCRPPGNRYPTPEEAAACLPNLRRQIEIIQPKIIVTLGNLSTQWLLNTTLGITKMRGKFTPMGGVLVMPTFHPSYLLRDPRKKREVWEDMQKVHAKMKELGLKVGTLKSGG